VTRCGQSSQSNIPSSFGGAGMADMDSGDLKTTCQRDVGCVQSHGATRRYVRRCSSRNVVERSEQVPGAIAKTDLAFPGSASSPGTGLGPAATQKRSPASRSTCSRRRRSSSVASANVTLIQDRLNAVQLPFPAGCLHAVTDCCRFRAPSTEMTCAALERTEAPGW